MYDDILLNTSANKKEQDTSNNIDSLFNNLASDIDSFNKYVKDVNRQKKENTKEEQDLLEEKNRLDIAKANFENYVHEKNIEYENKINDVNDYLNQQKQKLVESELEFKKSMNDSLKELDDNKKRLELEREKFKEEKQQFEVYKQLELDKIKHSEEILDSDKKQFERYKEVLNEKIELENKNIDQKYDKLRGFINQFNSDIKEIMEEDKEV